MPKDNTAKKIKGCIAENIAICHFQLKGYYVFKACQTNGPIDLVTVDPTNFRVRLYDVKTRRYRRDGSPINSVPRTKEGDIRIVYLEGDEIVEPQPRRKKTMERQEIHEQSVQKQKREKTLRKGVEENG